MKNASVRPLADAALRAVSVLGLTLGLLFAAAPAALANNTCSFAFDGDCDDGRPGALTSLCALGTDTADCGPVPGGGGGGGAAGPNSCSFAFDGDCDDGRPGSLTSLCAFGTDTADCSAIGGGGGGGGGAAGPNSCSFAFDGDCDDGRPGALTSLCAFGTDTADCSAIGGGGGGAAGPNSCSFAFDGDCDDGRPGSLTSLCAFGTDTADCSAIGGGGGGGGGTAAGPNSCRFAFDGDCDEPNGLNLCPWGTDTADCSNPNSNFGTGSGFAGGGGGCPVAPQPPRPSIPSTQEGVQIQTALNYFGFNAGAVDGQIGRGTRAAIERFQGAMGYPVNGRNLTADQLGTLLGAYAWATTQGGAQQAGVTGTALLIAYTNRLQAPAAPTPPAAPAPTGTTTAVPSVPQQPVRPPRGSAPGTAGTCPTPQNSDGLIVSYSDYQTAYFLDEAGDTVAFTTSNDGSFAFGTVYAPLGLMTLTWDSTAAGEPVEGTTQAVDYAGPGADLPRPTDGLTWTGTETASFEDGSSAQFATSVSVGASAREAIAGCSFAVRPLVVSRTPADGTEPYTEYFFELIDFGLVYYVGVADAGSAPQIEVATGLSLRPDDGIAPAAALPGAFSGVSQSGAAPAAPAPAAPAAPAPAAPAPAAPAPATPTPAAPPKE